MELLSMAVIAASVLVGIAAASWAGLKAWAGWLELKKMELAHTVGDRALPPATEGSRPPAAGSRWRTSRSGCASLKPSRPVSISKSPRTHVSPGAPNKRRSGSPPGPPLSFVRA